MQNVGAKMIKLAFKIASIFWILAPEFFLIGRYFGVWNFHYDLFLFGFLMVMFIIVCYFNIEE